MKLNNHAVIQRATISMMSIALTLSLMLFISAARAQAQSTDAKPVDVKSSIESYQTLYLTNLTSPNDFNDLQTDLRNMLPKAKIYGVASQGAISIRATSEDIDLARKVLSELDRTRKLYRLTYTITESDSGKHIGAQHYSLIVVSGQRTELKQGTRVPVFVGTNDAKSGTNPEVQYVGAQVQYVDVGLSIDASLDAYSDGVRLHSKVEQSSLADEKSGVGPQDPVLRQGVIDGTSTLLPGKPLLLGSIDIPDTTRHQEIEVLCEQLR